MKCRICSDDYEAPDIAPDGSCRWCAEKDRYAAFARSCGLDTYPDPSGERYLYSVDGGGGGWKKSEDTDFMAELWNALVRARGGDEGLLIEKE